MAIAASLSPAFTLSAASFIWPLIADLRVFISLSTSFSTSATFNLPLVFSTLLIGVPSGFAKTATGKVDPLMSLAAVGYWVLANCIATHCDAYSDKMRDCLRLELSISFCEAGNQ